VLDLSPGEQVDASSERARFFACDVSSKPAIDATFAAVLETFGGLDVLVSNAGIIRATPFLEITEDEWDLVVDVNLKSAFLCGQAAARAMVASSTAGAIVNIASLSAVMTTGDALSYAASKGGVVSLTSAMSLSLAPHGIRVNAVGPGTIETEMMRGYLATEAARALPLSRTPLQRFGRPEEIANVVAFLASDEASYMTGQTLFVEGGRMALNYTIAPPAPPEPSGQ
jgi:glucose 1-dehydrogenase